LSGANHRHPAQHAGTVTDTLVDRQQVLPDQTPLLVRVGGWRVSGEETRAAWPGVDFDALGEGLSPSPPREAPRDWWRPVKTAFRLAGIEIRRDRPAEPPLDFRGSGLGAFEALYRAGGRPFVLDVPIGRLRTPFGFRPERAAGGARVELAHRIVEGRSADELRVPLETFYGRWRPGNRAETLGLLADEASAKLRTLPPWAPVMPWTVGDPIALTAMMAVAYRNENAEHGHALGVRHGHPAGGPWSRERVDVEVRRMQALVTSVQRHGYRRDSTLMGCAMIGADGEWGVLVQRGQHRAAAAEALGITHLPIMLEPGRPAVRHDEVSFWPLVRSGVFTPRQATGVFDRMMAGEPPPGCPHPGSPDRLGWQAARGNGSAQGS
jgi:hypothetical protein